MEKAYVAVWSLRYDRTFFSQRTLKKRSPRVALKLLDRSGPSGHMSCTSSAYGKPNSGVDVRVECGRDGTESRVRQISMSAGWTETQLNLSISFWLQAVEGVQRDPDPPALQAEGPGGGGGARDLAPDGATSDGVGRGDRGRVRESKTVRAGNVWAGGWKGHAPCANVKAVHCVLVLGLDERVRKLGLGIRDVTWGRTWGWFVGRVGGWVWPVQELEFIPEGARGWPMMVT